MFDNLTPEQFVKMMAQAQVEAEKLRATSPTKSTLSGVKDLTEFLEKTKQLTANLKKANDGMSVYKSLISKTNTAIDNIKDDLDELDERYKKANTIAEKKQIDDARNALRDQAVRTAQRDSMVNLTKTITDVSSKAFTGIGTFVKGLQSGQSGIDLASGLMGTAIDFGTGATKAFADAAGAGGQIMATSTNPSIRRMGTAAAVAAPLISGLADTTNRLAKFGIEVLQKEVEKTVKAFNDASSSGAIFANGMDDLRLYSGKAGLTVDQFGNVIKNNAASLAESGYTVSGGAKIVATVTNQFRTQMGKSGMSLQREMQNLGYGFEEQAELAAKITADLRKTGGTATNAQMAGATIDLAKNMRVVADIMGEDAKAKMDQAKKLSEQYAFFAKVNRIARETNDPGLPSRVRASLALMNESQQRAAIQATVLGGAVTDLSANVYGQADAGREFAASLLRGNASMGDMVKGFAAANDNFSTKYGQTAEAISRAGIATGDSLNGLVAGADSLGQQSFKLNSENLANAIAAAERTSAATGKLHDSVMGAESAAQELKMALQNELTPAIKQFAKVSNEMLGEVQKMMRKAGVSSASGTAGPSFIERNGRDILSALGMGIGAVAGGGGMGVLSGGTLAIGGAISGGMAGKAGGEWLADALGLEAYENGGVSSGSKSGHPEMLHGTEAVVPLPNGKSIPVTFDGGSMAELTEKMDQLLSVSRDTRDYTEKLLKVSM